MTVMTASPTRTRGAPRDVEPTHRLVAPGPVYADPLDVDEPGDDVVVTTRRAISRVALVATEAASRFQREGVVHDPMTWMLAPRRLFAGASALDACLDREACLRGVLLHGLSLGLDADPSALDALADDEHLDEGIRDGVGPAKSVRPDGHVDRRGGPGDRIGSSPPRGGREPQPGPRLFTATVITNDGQETVHAFHASLAVDEAEVAGRLRARLGAAGDDAAIVRGFDGTSPIVEALVPEALRDALAMIDAHPGSPLAAGLDLNVEQRFLG